MEAEASDLVSSDSKRARTAPSRASALPCLQPPPRTWPKKTTGQNVTSRTPTRARTGSPPGGVGLRPGDPSTSLSHDAFVAGHRDHVQHTRLPPAPASLSPRASDFQLSRLGPEPPPSLGASCPFLLHLSARRTPTLGPANWKNSICKEIVARKVHGLEGNVARKQWRTTYIPFID